jgi:hypothetical protein
MRARVAQLREFDLHERVIDHGDASRKIRGHAAVIPNAGRFVTCAADFACRAWFLHLAIAVRLLLLLLIPALFTARGAEPVAIEIDLTAQKAFLLQDGQITYETPISSGRSSHPTPTGNFSVLEKDLNHLSSRYGRIVGANGRTLVRDADSGMTVPAGAKFVRAPMKYFLRFDGATGMHAGYLPGYPASHGCVRLPAAKAELFYHVAEIGTPVRVHGKAPASAPAARRPKATPTPTPTPEPRKWYQIFRRATPTPRPAR